MVSFKHVMVFLLIIMTASCGRDSSRIDLNYLYHANPTEDVKKSIEIKDYRFYGVYEYSVQIPNVQRKCVNVDLDVKMIAGTSDASLTYEEEKLNTLALVYARAYNTQMIGYLQDQGLYKCEHPPRFFKEN